MYRDGRENGGEEKERKTGGKKTKEDKRKVK